MIAKVLAARPAFTQRQMDISQQQVDFFQENGYLVVENALTAEEIESLRRETVRNR